MRGVRRLIGRRLGRCVACMRASAKMSAASWAGVLAFRVLGADRVANLMLGAAIASTAFLLLHGARWATLRWGERT